MARVPYQDAFEYFIGSRTRAALIRRLVTNPQRRVWLRELYRGLHAGMGAIHRELTILESLDLIIPRAQAGARFYEVNPSHPLYRPLKELAESGATYTRPFRREKLARPRVLRREGNTPIKRANPRMIETENATDTRPDVSDGKEGTRRD
ncbi:MAG: hypothetical protein RBS78_01660 [Coriobacteriia bacterium]|jgi:hypothetical protein|nr:hypothetical protein [Coriobacteriia bacterium]